MTTQITPQLTPDGLLIPREAIQEWIEEGIEVIKGNSQIIIQPQAVDSTDSEKAKQVLRDAGLLVKFEFGPLDPPISLEERERLAEKLSHGRPLSELVIEERRSGW